MGQKINPIGFRLSFKKNWLSLWYASKNEFHYGILEDYKLRFFLRKYLEDSLYTKITIDRGHQINITILSFKYKDFRANRNKKACLLEVKLSKITSQSIGLVIEKPRIKTGAQLIADDVSKQIKSRVLYRKIAKTVIDDTMKLNNVKGIKVMFSGRLGGAEIARKEWFSKGTIPLHTFRANIDYGFKECFTIYGVVGIKVWLYISNF